MAVLAEYRILTVPRFSASEMDVRLYDSVVSQRALWGHLALHLIRDHDVSAELRLTRERGPIAMCLRLHGTESPQVAARIGELEELLPGEFRWQRVEPDVRLDLSRIRMARVVRRLEYVDLPVPSAMRGPGGEAGGMTLPSSGGFTFAGTDEDEELRELPSLETAPVELLTRRFCLPLPGTIDELKPRQKALFGEIQRADDAAVSICVHPMRAEDRPACQRFALNWKRFLDPFASELASAGFASVRDLRAAYDRFGLPPGYLVHTSIRVAARDDVTVIALANAMASFLGGVRAFHVIPPTRQVEGRALFDRGRDVPSQMTPGVLANQRGAIAQSLAEASVRPLDDPGMTDFLLHAPHLYTLEEAEAIVRLPLADDEGLPGFESEAVPPFTIPSLDFLPAYTPEQPVAPPPVARVRVGMLRKPGAHPHAASEHRFVNYAWHTVAPKDLTKHALIVGSTGSGKTMSTLFLVRELTRLRVPTMIIEPVKTEYFQRLSPFVPGLKRFRFEGNGSDGPGAGYLIFDPLRVPDGISVARHCSYLKSCFEAAFPLTDFLALLLENGLLEYYTRPIAEGGCGLSKFARGGSAIGRIDGPPGEERVFPSFATFKDYLLGPFLEREFAGATASGGRNNTAQELKDVFRRRMVNLSESVVGESFRLADRLYVETRNHERHASFYDPLAATVRARPRTTNPASYGASSAIIELDAIPDANQKALVMAFLLTYLFEQRQAEDVLTREGALGEPAVAYDPDGLRHFLIIEEAHRLLASATSGNRGAETVGESSKAKAVSLFVDMLAEIRAYGQGLAIVEQIPTKIAPEAVKNTSLKIMLRLTAKDDREYLGEAMNFSDAQMRFVTNLKVQPPSDDGSRHGQINFVVFDEGLEQPLLLSLPLDAKPAGAGSDPWLYNDFFREGRTP